MGRNAALTRKGLVSWLVLALKEIQMFDSGEMAEKDQKCCGGEALSRRLECCGKGPLSKSFDPRREHCCVARGFAEVYSPVEQVCCGSQVILKRLVSPGFRPNQDGSGC